jgi:hypothetical protein
MAKQAFLVSPFRYTVGAVTCTETYSTVAKIEIIETV